MNIFNYYPSDPKKPDPDIEKKIFFHSLLIPSLFVAAFWIIKIIEYTTSVSFVKFGIFPLEIKGLKGLIFSPFIHSDFNHLISKCNKEYCQD